MIKVNDMGTFEGAKVVQASLISSTGVEVDILNYGVVVRDWRVPVANSLRSIVLGFETFDPYPEHSPHLGAIVGRVANRIRHGQFKLEGKVISLPTDKEGLHLHGGKEGLSSRVWELETDSANNRVRFSHCSPAGHMGYPGNVKFEAIYSLKGNILRLDLSATLDTLTPISLTQHNYFNLGNDRDVLDHLVSIAASDYTPLDDGLLPTGEIRPVAGSVYDFRTGRNLRTPSGTPIDYDLNFQLDEGRDVAVPVAKVVGPDEALTLELKTDRPGLQFYNAVTTDVPVPGLEGKIYGKHSGFCLEDQMFPDAVNHSNFPSVLCSPDDPYAHWCEIEVK